jgi:hypothetical protein
MMKVYLEKRKMAFKNSYHVVMDISNENAIRKIPGH